MSRPVTVDDVRDLLDLKEQYVPPELLPYHRAYHDVTNLRARIGMGDVPDDVVTSPAWESLEAETENAESDLVYVVRDEYPELVAEALDDYRGERA